jgi:hypothetical protein
VWENELNGHNIVHFLQFKILKAFFPERIQEESGKICLLRVKFDEKFKDIGLEFILFALPRCSMRNSER